MGDYEINYIPILSTGGFNKTAMGNIIIIIHQHACNSKGQNLHSFGQIDHFKKFSDNESIKVGSKKHVLTNDN